MEATKCERSGRAGRSWCWSVGRRVRDRRGASENRVPLPEDGPHTAYRLTVIPKAEPCEGALPYVLACPSFKTSLQEIGDMFFSPEAGVVYPVVGGIPCLRIENVIFASKYQEVIEMGTFS